MLIARFNVITLEAELKPEVAASVCAIVYAGYLMGTEVDELKHLHILFTLKYGKPFTQDVIDNKEKYINHRLLKILTMTECPDVTVVDAYLEAIAQSYGVEYVPQVTAVQPISSTLGIALPTPGQPMPGSAVPEPMPDRSGGEAPSAAEPAFMMGTEVVLPTAQPIATPAVASGGGSNFSAGEVVGMAPPPSGAGSASGAVPFRVQLSKGARRIEAQPRQGIDLRASVSPSMRKTSSSASMLPTRPESMPMALAQSVSATRWWQSMGGR